MSSKNSPPKYLIVYQCESCGQESGYTERDKPRCRFCDSPNRMVVISKQEITPEVVASRLRSAADNMMANLTKAFEQLPNVDENILGDDKDAETEMLRLMEKAKKLHDKVLSLELKEPAGKGKAGKGKAGKAE